MAPGVPHHVTQRGNNRQDVFFVDEDRRVYLAYLSDSAAQFGVTLSAYCLMTNHVHLVATPETEHSLAKALGRTHLMYAQHIHRLHGRAGHFWQNRFYSCPLDEAHLQTAMAYVELNPVRAGMVGAPWEHAWSSAAAHTGEGEDPSGMLDLGGWFEDTPAAEWKSTLKAVAESDARLDGLRLHTRTGRPLGTDAFLSKVEVLLGRRILARGKGRPTGSKDKTRRKPRADRQTGNGQNQNS